MNSLADKLHKQEVPAMHAYSDMHSNPWPHYSTIIRIPKQVAVKFSANWCATIYTYVQGWLLNWENILTIDGCFNFVTSHVGARLAEEASK